MTLPEQLKFMFTTLHVPGVVLVGAGIRPRRRAEVGLA